MSQTSDRISLSLARTDGEYCLKSEEVKRNHECSSKQNDVVNGNGDQFWNPNSFTKTYSTDHVDLVRLDLLPESHNSESAPKLDSSDDESDGHTLNTQPNIPTKENKKHGELKDKYDAGPGSEVIVDNVKLVDRMKWLDKSFLGSFLSKKWQENYQNMLISAATKSEKNKPEDEQMESKTITINQISEKNNKHEFFSLQQLRIIRTWKLRKCAHEHFNKSYQEDNGPLACAYRDVFSIQVTDSSAHHADEQLKASVITIFFYNDHAKKLSRSIHPNLFLDINNISYSSIFPSLSNDDLLTHDMIVDERQVVSPYVICIGGVSRAKHQNVSIRFDYMIEIIWKERNGTKRYFPINKETRANQMDGFDLKNHVDDLENSMASSEKVHEETQTVEARRRRKFEDQIEDFSMNEDSLVDSQQPHVYPIDQSKRKTTKEHEISETNSAIAPDSFKIFGVEYHFLNGLKKQFQLQQRDFSTSATSHDAGNTINISPYGQNQQKYPTAPKKRLFNCFAVVLSFTPARLTTRGDWSMSLILIDDSSYFPKELEQNSSENHSAASLPRFTHINQVTLNIFDRNRENLPQVSCAGDIIRCHRCSLQEWNGNIQLCAQFYSSFVVVRPKSPQFLLDSSTQDFEANKEREEAFKSMSEQYWDITSRSKSISYGKLHADRFCKLWKWGNERFTLYPTLYSNDEKCTLAQLETDDVILEAERIGLQQNKNPHVEVQGHITVMVTDIITNSDGKNFTPKGFLRVWDGTGASVTDVHPITGEPITHYELSQDLLRSTTRVTNLISKLNEKEPKIPPLQYFSGRIVNVAIWEVSHWDLIVGGDRNGGNRRKIEIGDFIRLRNINDGRILDNRGLLVHSKSALMILPDTTYEVRNLLINHQNRIERGDRCNPNSEVQALNKTIRVKEFRDIEEDRFVTTRKDQIERGYPCCTLDVCLGEQSSTSFSVLFQIESTYPSLSVVCDPCDERKLSVLKAFCVPVINGFETNLELERLPQNRKSLFYFRFIVRIYDDTAGLDAIICNEEAQKLLGVSADEIYGSEETGEEGRVLDARRKCKGSLERLVNGTWRGTLISKYHDKRRYFLLESCSLQSICL